MSSIQSALANQPRRQYVTAAVFNNDLFTYTLTTNPTTNVTTGAIAPVTGGSAALCPAGRILRENGQKLYPGVNVGITTFMVGVIDTITLLSGYIDPNSPIYGVYSTALPFAPTYGVYPNIQYNGVDPGPGGLGDEGPPVFTNGNIISVSGDIITETGGITSNGNIISVSGDIITQTGGITSKGNIISVSGDIITQTGGIYSAADISANTSIRAGTTITATTGLGYFNSAFGGNVTQGAGSGKSTTVVLNAVTGTITMNNASLATQATVFFTFTNSFIDTSDLLVLTNTGGAVAIGCYTLNALCAAGSATVYVRNITAGALLEALVIQFMLFKG
jgi:hypothetical protein